MEASRDAGVGNTTLLSSTAGWVGKKVKMGMGMASSGAGRIERLVCTVHAQRCGLTEGVCKEDSFDLT